jgi:nicotinate phosphoribosyltransferase
LLVDTIDTLESGVPNAIRVFEELRAGGHRPGGIRLDSGDLAYLAIQSAKLLDGAGFAEVPIVLSSDLDELAIWQILSQIDDEAPRYGIHPEALSGRLIYGVGTRLITSQGDSSLDGVFKLTAMKEGGTWLPAVKVSESSAKVPVPGEKAVWRVYDRRGYATADVIAHPDEDLLAAEELRLFHPHREASRTMAGAQIEHVESLLEPVYSGGQERPPASLEAMRERRTHDLGRLDQGVRRIVTPHIYHVSLTERMKSLQRELVNDARASA